MNKFNQYAWVCDIQGSITGGDIMDAVGSLFGSGAGDAAASDAASSAASDVGGAAADTASGALSGAAADTGSSILSTGADSAASAGIDAGSSAASSAINASTVLGAGVSDAGSVAGAAPGVTTAAAPTAMSAGQIASSIGAGPTADLSAAPAVDASAAAPAAAASAPVTPIQPIAMPDALGGDTAAPSSIAKALGISDKELLGAGIAGAGLAKDLFSNQKPKGLNQTTQEAQSAQTQGGQLMSYLTNGTLPAGAQTALNNATAAAQAQIRSKYASTGQSGSSAEQQELQQVQLNAQSEAYSLASQLFTQGLNETQMSAELYKTILGQANTDNTDIGNAIGNISGALSGGSGKGQTLTLNAASGSGTPLTLSTGS